MAICIRHLFSLALWTSAVLAGPRILVYSATREFRHDSIPSAIQAITSLGATLGASISNTEDLNYFTGSNLAQFDLLVFLDNTGEVLDTNGKAAFEDYVLQGGNFLGIHSASDCLRTTEFYGNTTGAWFDYHPEIQSAIVEVIDMSHPATSKVPSRWTLREEIYNFKSDPRSLGAVVLIAADESTYTDSGTRKYSQGSPHPLVWYQERGRQDPNRRGYSGRSFYTSLGHLNETWQTSEFQSHILGAISWTLDANTTLARNASARVGNPSQQNPTVSRSSLLAVTSPTSTGSATVTEADIPSSVMLWLILLASWLLIK